MRELLKQWGIGRVYTIAPTPLGGGRTWFVKTMAKGDFVLKVSDLMRSEREYDLLLELSKTEIPVALPITTMEGDWCARSCGGKVYCLYPRLPGNVITEHYAGDAEKRALGFGRAIGLLHTCFQARADVNGHRELALLEQIEQWALPRIREEGSAVDARAIERIWRDAEAELGPLYSKLPRQVIHRDPHPSNMLFSAGRLTGFLDFEMVRRGPRAFDVCYCGSSILVEGFEDSEKAQRWARLVHSLTRGYGEYFPLVASERLAMYGVLVSIELLFIAFCMDTRNYDAARTNERLLHWLATNRQVLAT